VLIILFGLKEGYGTVLLIRNTIGDGVWSMVGDFNAVCHVDERRGVSVEASLTRVLEINYFNSFIPNVDLLDVDPLGRKFTWHHASGLAMSCIDRVLISDGWIGAWGNTSLWRTISDHSPLVLKYGNTD